MDIKIDCDSVVVFDLDDTLYNEIDFLISAYKEISSYLDIDNCKILYSKMLSLYKNSVNVFDFLVKNYDITKVELIKIYVNHIPDIKLNIGALNLLESIKIKGGKIAIITDGRSISQRNKIKALKIEHLIDFLSISEEIKFDKPSFEPFLRIQSFFELKKYYYFADNHKKDFVTPNKLSWSTIEVIDNGKNIHSNSFSYEESIYRPTNVIFNLQEIKII